jgi:hypothetical protein
MRNLPLEGQYRLFLLGMAGLIFASTLIELILQEHTGEPAQLIPFLLCGLGILALIVVLMRPQRGPLRVLQGVMGLCLLGSALGLYEHIQANLGFALEIQPNAAAGQVLAETLTGAAPMLAPGMLAIAALLALAATYRHPGLKSPVLV